MPPKSQLKFIPVFSIFLLCAVITFSAVFLELRGSPYISSVIYFYVIPVAVAAYSFGLNPAVFISFICCLLYVPVASKHLSVSLSSGLQETLSFILFIFIGLASGFLSDRVKKEKQHAEFHSVLQENAALSSYNVERLSADFLALLKKAAGFQFACFVLEARGTRIEIHSDDSSKSFYEALPASATNFLRLARESQKTQLLSFPEENLKYYSLHFFQEAHGHASGFIECVWDADADMPSAFTKKLMTSLCEAFAVHVKKSIFYQDTVLISRFLEHLLAIAPFGVMRLDADRREIYRNAFKVKDPALSEKALSLFLSSEIFQEPVYFHHEDKAFLLQCVPVTDSESRGYLLMLQSMEEKRKYELAEGNYKVRSAFLKHVSSSFLDKIQVFEDAFGRMRNGKDASAADEAARLSRDILSYVDRLLLEVKNDA